MTNTIESQNKDYFPALTGIRAISAYFVFFHHFNYTAKGTLLHDFVDGLHIGVTIFFVLSGFLITYRYFDNGPLSLRKYFTNRVARIYPMYFILTAVTFLYAAVAWHQHSLHDLKIFILNITFLRGFFDDFKFTGVGPGWSLTVEEAFYLLAPVFFILIKKSKKFLVILPALCIVTGMFLVKTSHYLSAGSFFGTYYFMFAYTFFGRATEFFIGICLAIFFKKNKDIISTKWCTLAGCAGIFLSLFALVLIKKNTNLAYGVEHPFGLVTNNLLLPLLGIAPLFWGLLTEKTWLQNFLKSRIMILLGKSSYIFYLIHFGVIYHLLSKFFSGNLFIFVSLNVISILLFLFIEEPANIYIRKVFKRPNI